MNKSEELSTKLIAFLLTLSPEQYQWLKTLKETTWPAESPEDVAHRLFYSAALHEIPAGVPHSLVKASLEAAGVPFVALKLSNARYLAYKEWENAGLETFDPPPPLILDPMFKPAALPVDEKE